MVLYTGDTHGRFERIIGLAQRLHLTADDVIVILGDAGFNFYGNKYGDAKRKKQVDRLGVPIFCIHGNHEMRPANIPSYTVQIWHGGQIWVEPEYPNLLFARDGEIYDLDGKQAIVLGGAYSVDKFYRLMQNPFDPKWWPDEQPDDAIKQRAERVLEKNHWQDRATADRSAGGAEHEVRGVFQTGSRHRNAPGRSLRPALERY